MIELEAKLEAELEAELAFDLAPEAEADLLDPELEPAPVDAVGAATEAVVGVSEAEAEAAFVASFAPELPLPRRGLRPPPLRLCSRSAAMDPRAEKGGRFGRRPKASAPQAKRTTEKRRLSAVRGRPSLPLPRLWP